MKMRKSERSGTRDGVTVNFDFGKHLGGCGEAK